MKTLMAYLLRCALCAPAIAGILTIVYIGKPAGPSDNLPAAYLWASIILTGCACCGWALRIRPTRSRELISAALIAGMIASGLISVSTLQYTDGSFSLEYFYNNDYALAFQIAAPAAIALLTALGCFIPDNDDPI